MYRIVCVLVFLIAAPQVLAKDGVTITFEGTSVVAHVNAGAQTAWFSIAHTSDSRGGMMLVNRAFLRGDDDGDGRVQLILEEAPPSSSLWMVVDLKSGDYAIETVTRNPPRRRALTPAMVRPSDPSGGRARFLDDHARATVFVVRPGVGAWVGKIHDGSPEDADGAVDGHLAAQIAKFVAVGNSPPAPDDFLRGDVVALVEPLTLAVTDGVVVR